MKSGSPPYVFVGHGVDIKRTGFVDQFRRGHTFRQRRCALNVGVRVAILFGMDDIQQARLPEQVLKIEVVSLIVVELGPDETLDKRSEVSFRPPGIRELAGDREWLFALAFLELFSLVAKFEAQADFVRHLLLSLPRCRYRADVDYFVKSGNVVALRYWVKLAADPDGDGISTRYFKQVMLVSEANGRISELRNELRKIGLDIESSTEKDAYGFAYQRLTSLAPTQLTL
jgi:hypothetical protein